MDLSNKCSFCNTYSVDNNGGEYESYGYGVTKWCVTYFCVTCDRECTMTEEDICSDGDTIYF